MSDRFSNFHTHTCLCDGKDTPEELVLRALELGCPALGFSGHSYAPYDEGYCMSVAQTAEYKAEIRRLQQKYAGRICIYMGIEQDFYSEAFTEGYDYVIGSVHYLRKNGAYLPVDASQAQQAQALLACAEALSTEQQQVTVERLGVAVSEVGHARELPLHPLPGSRLLDQPGPAQQLPGHAVTEAGAQAPDPFRVHRDTRIRRHGPLPPHASQPRPGRPADRKNARGAPRTRRNRCAASGLRPG